MTLGPMISINFQQTLYRGSHQSSCINPGVSDQSKQNRKHHKTEESNQTADTGHYEVQSTLDISKLWGLFFTSSNYPKCKLICTFGNLDLQKSIQHQIMVGERNQNVFLIQIGALSFAEFEVSKFDI